jgi:hypothetical protein
MALRDRFDHLPDARRQLYQQMLAESPRLVTTVAISATEQVLPWLPCSHRGEESGTCQLRRCCGQPSSEPVPAYRCELLDTTCVEFGTPAERNVETCATCSEREVGGVD